MFPASTTQRRRHSTFSISSQQRSVYAMRSVCITRASRTKLGNTEMNTNNITISYAALVSYYGDISSVNLIGTLQQGSFRIDSLRLFLSLFSFLFGDNCCAGLAVTVLYWPMSLFLLLFPRKLREPCKLTLAFWEIFTFSSSLISFSKVHVVITITICTIHSVSTITKHPTRVTTPWSLATGFKRQREIV